MKKSNKNTSVEDFNIQGMLQAQKAINERVVEELKAISSTSDPAEFVKRAAELIERYARYATLTEFKTQPNLLDVTKWGATFGVTALVGALILDHARQLIDVRSDLRLEYLRFLDALAEPGGGSIDMDALTRVFAILSESYGIVWANDDSLSLTVAGKRVYLHMLDAAKFVEQVSEAAQKFRDPEESDIPL
jgi:hypothetical protein